VISFGLVSVPVALYSATKAHDVSFNQFQKGTSDRIRYQRVNERTGKEVDYQDIVRGADVGNGKYVMVESGELDAVAPGRSRSLDIHTFVDLDEIDPIYFQKSYYLAPGSEETAKTYALLRDALADANRAAIGTLVMRGKEYLTAIRPDNNLLVLETMFFADEIRDPKEQVDRIPARAKGRPEELKMAGQLIDSMAGAWNPKEFRDTYADRVEQLINAKKKGAEVTVAEEAPEPTNVVDLTDALRASVEAARQRRTGTGAKKATSRAASKKPAAKTAASRPAKAAKSTTAKSTAAKKQSGTGRSKATSTQTKQARRKAS
jgi:DNA end-binding protein Ku